MSFKFNALTGGFNTFTQADLTSIGGSNDLSFGDSAKIKFGAGDDLQIYHDGAHSYIANSTNNLYVNAPNFFHLGVSNGGDKYITALENGAVELFYDNSKKFETTSIGCKLTDDDTTTALQFVNSDGDNGYVMGESTNIIGFKDSQAHWLTKCFKDGGVELYYDNSKKFETTSSGATISGKLLLGGATTLQSSTNADDLQIGANNQSNQTGITLGSAAASSLRFMDAANDAAGYLLYNHGNDVLTIGSTNHIQLSAGGVVVSVTNNDQVEFEVGATAKFQRNTGGTNSNAALFNSAGSLVGKIMFNNSETIYSTSGSDRTLKKNFENWTESVLPLFKNLTPQKFNFTQEEDSETKHKGFIAQDEVANFPEAYPKDPETDKYLYSPNNMVVYLMKAIQELEAKVAALEAA